MEHVPNQRNAPIVNEKTGEWIRFNPGPEDVCNFEFRVKPGGGVFLPHVHLRQSEKITLLEGELTLVIDGVCRCLRTGETLVLPPRTGHTIENAGTVEAVADVTFTPAGRTEQFLRTVFGLARDGRTRTDGDLSMLQAAVLLPYHDVYRADKPVFVQKLLFAVLRPFSLLAGCRARYPEYESEAPRRDGGAARVAKGRAKAVVAGVGLFLLASVGLANLVHRVLFPPDPPDSATYPRAGDVFASTVEGFRLEVVAVRDGWLILRIELAPGAPGPPMHYHHSFREVFTVESGTLHLELADGVARLGPGEQQGVDAGVFHRPHNPTHEKVIIAGDTPAMPQSFGACLVQIYHFLDAAEGQMGLGFMLRIAALDPICDSTLLEIPTAINLATKWLIVPFARPFGFANYYPELSLHPAGRSD